MKRLFLLLFALAALCCSLACATGRAEGRQGAPTDAKAGQLNALKSLVFLFNLADGSQSVTFTPGEDGVALDASGDVSGEQRQQSDADADVDADLDVNPGGPDANPTDGRATAAVAYLGTERRGQGKRSGPRTGASSLPPGMDGGQGGKVYLSPRENDR